MKPNDSLEEKIRKIKDRLAECRDYISSDFCIQCIEIHKEIDKLEEVLRILQNERIG